MLARLRTLFAPPTFADDEEKTRVARLLQIILITVMVLVMLFSVPAFVMTPEIGRVVIEIFLGLWALLMLAGELVSITSAVPQVLRISI